MLLICDGVSEAGAAVLEVKWFQLTASSAYAQNSRFAGSVLPRPREDRAKATLPAPWSSIRQAMPAEDPNGNSHG